MNSNGVDTLQDEFEFDRLLEIVKAHKPKRIIEIGVWDGGTLQHWLAKDRTVVAVEVHPKNPGLWQSWAEKKGATLHVLAGDSASRSVLEQAKEHGPYDFAFIDGDHAYEGVVRDWENYHPMMAPGAIIAFHDIVYETVGRLWGQIVAIEGSRTVSIRHSTNMGIGAVWI